MSEPIQRKSGPTGISRRGLLQGSAGMAGILATGLAPAVHAQDKIVLRYLGTAVNQDKAIAEKFKADTGIQIQYVAVSSIWITPVRSCTSATTSAVRPPPTPHQTAGDQDRGGGRGTVGW